MMWRMTMFQLGVVLFAVSLSTQVVSQNTSTSGMGNSTTNSTTNSTMAPGPYSGPTSTTTSPAGAGVSLHAGAFSLLIPVAVAASLHQRYC